MNSRKMFWTDKNLTFWLGQDFIGGVGLKPRRVASDQCYHFHERFFLEKRYSVSIISNRGVAPKESLLVKVNIL